MDDTDDSGSYHVNKSSAVVEMGDRLITIHITLAEKWGTARRCCAVSVHGELAQLGWVPM